MLEKRKRDVAYSVINSGTSIGIILSAPMALFAGDQWRLAWMMFALIALVVTVWNLLILTRKKVPALATHGTTLSEKINLLFHADSYRLFVFAFLLGVTTAAYWVFAVEYITHTHAGIGFFHWHISTAIFPKLFWIMVGISGLFGGSAGFFVNSLGLKKTLLLSILSMVLSILLMVTLSHHWLGLFLSAFIFGSTFIVVTALLGIWSISIFFNRPAIGFGMAFLLLSVGQMLGPIVWSVVISLYSMQSMFYLSALLGLLLLFIKPIKDIHSMNLI